MFFDELANLMDQAIIKAAEQNPDNKLFQRLARDIELRDRVQATPATAGAGKISRYD